MTNEAQNPKPENQASQQFWHFVILALSFIGHWSLVILTVLPGARLPSPPVLP